MKTSSSSSLVMLLAAGSMLLGTLSPSGAAEPLVGQYAEASTTNTEVIAAARFAVKTQAVGPDRTSELTLIEILSARLQVVSGTNYRLRLKVKADGTTLEAEVVVWRKLSQEYALTSWTWK
ncbi:MAG: cystatin domain-containing protein [bacterium]